MARRNVLIWISALLLSSALFACSPPAPAPTPSPAARPSQPSPTLIPLPTATPGETVVVPTPIGTPSRTPSPQGCTETQGSMLITSLDTDLLRNPLDVRVYLPACYSFETTRSYPVLYMIHGQSYNDDQWDRLGLDEAADALIAAGEIEPLLIVMPRDRLWVDPVDSPFDEAFIEVLIPWVERSLRVDAAAGRAVGGLSRGAGWALHFGLTYPEMFRAIGLHSAPIFVSDAARLRTILSSDVVLPAIRMDIGERDFLLESNTWLAARLDEFDVPHEYYLLPGYHDEAYWSSHVESYLRWYAAQLSQQ